MQIKTKSLKVAILLTLVMQLNVSGQAGSSNQSAKSQSRTSQDSYAVGFKTYRKTDYSRPDRPKRDYEGNNLPDIMPTDWQVSVWYPARKSARPPLKFSEYLYLNQQTDKARVLSDADKKLAADSLKNMFKFGGGRDLTEAEMQTILDRPTLAQLNAAPVPGKFPVIISGLGAPSNSSAFGELLASHGYIVITIPQNRFGTLQATKPQLALEGHMRNMEMLLAEARQLPNADFGRIGVVGLNFDGMAALLFQMRNMVADAIVSLDGWEGKQFSIQNVQNSPYYDPLKMRVPYLLFLQDEQPAQPNPGLTLDYTIFDALKYAERSAFVVNGINHFYYVGNPAGAGMVPPDKQAGVGFIHQTLLHFLDLHVKQAAAAPTIQAAAGTSALLRAEKRVKAFKAVPFEAEFERIVMEEQDVAKATRIFRAAKLENPEIVLFSENTINLFAFRFQRQNKPEIELALRRLHAEAYPQSTFAVNRLAATLMTLGQNEEAITTFEKGIAAGLPKAAAFYNIACAYVRLKQTDKAFEFLNKAIDAGFNDRQTFESDTDLAPLRADARFQQTLARLLKS